MERYELSNGDVCDILTFKDEYAVAVNGTILYAGTYSDCRKYIEAKRLAARR